MASTLSDSKFDQVFRQKMNAIGVDSDAITTTNVEPGVRYPGVNLREVEMFWAWVGHFSWEANKKCYPDIDPGLINHFKYRLRHNPDGRLRVEEKFHKRNPNHEPIRAWVYDQDGRLVERHSYWRIIDKGVLVRAETKCEYQYGPDGRLTSETEELFPLDIPSDIKRSMRKTYDYSNCNTEKPFEVITEAFDSYAKNSQEAAKEVDPMSEVIQGSELGGK